jgi:hypothetical protein
MAKGEVTDRLRGLWERYAPRYDHDTGFYDLCCSVTAAHGHARRRPAKYWRSQSVPAGTCPSTREESS